MTDARQSASILWTPALSESEADLLRPLFQIQLGQRVLREVQKRIVSGAPVDSLGLLLGEVGGRPGSATAYVSVDRFLPSVDPIAEDAEAERMGRVLHPLLEAASLAGKTVAGWYRGHARLGATLSAAEQRLHERWFGEPWHFALVGLADPARPGGAVFAWAESERLTPAPFHELLEASSLLPGGRKATSLTWRNYRTTDAVVRPGEPVEPVEPEEPVEPVEPEALSVGPFGLAGTAEREAPDAAGESVEPGEPVEPASPSWSFGPAGGESRSLEPDRASEPRRPAASTDSPSAPPERAPGPLDRAARPPDRVPGPPDRAPRPPDRYPPYREPASGRDPSPARRRGEVASASPRLVLPDPAPSRRAGGPGRRLAALVAILLLAGAGWMAWQRWAPGGEGTAGSPEAPDAIEFAEPASGGEGESGEEGVAETPGAPEDAAPSGAAAPAGTTRSASSRPDPLDVLADRVFASVEAYRRARREFDRGTADCRELRAAHERVDEAFQALSERIAALGGRVGPAAAAEFRRAAAGAEEVARHLTASGCPPAR